MPSPNRQPSHRAWHPKVDAVAAQQAQQMKAWQRALWQRFDPPGELLHVG
jgi:hypothetical protein